MVDRTEPDQTILVGRSHGRSRSCRSHVPSVASQDESRSLVPECRSPRVDRSVLWIGDR